MLATAQPPPIVHDGDEEEDSVFRNPRAPGQYW